MYLDQLHRRRARSFEVAREHGLFIRLRSACRSYGDAAMIVENICPDLTRKDRIVDWDPGTGVIQVEPGVTLR